MIPNNPELVHKVLGKTFEKKKNLSSNFLQNYYITFPFT